MSELGWACHSLDEEGSSLFVRVWKEEGLEQEVSPSLTSGYRMRVQEVSGRKVQTLADVRQVDVWVVGQGLLFYGQSAEPTRKGVQLWIQDQSQGLRGLPSQLMLFEGSEQEREGTTSEASEASEDMKNASERRVRMSCSRTRS